MAKRFFWFTRLFIRCGGWIALFPLLIGLSLTMSAITASKNAALMMNDGVETTATVLTKRYTPSSGDDQRGSQRQPATYAISFEYTPKQSRTPIEPPPIKGPPIKAQKQVSAHYYNSVSVGQQITLRYLPQTPTVYELFHGALKKQSIADQIVGFAFAVIGFGACVWFAVTALKALRARENVGMIIESYVSRRAKWPPFFNRMQYQVGSGNSAKHHKSFIRPFWAYRGLKRGDKTRVAMTNQGPYWANDLFL